jgi:hypothetical protein
MGAGKPNEAITQIFTLQQYEDHKQNHYAGGCER